MKRQFISDPAVKASFDSHRPEIRARLMRLRELVFEAAAEIGIGDLVETLKWNQPAYLTRKPRTGSTIRIDAVKQRPDTCAIYFHCQTTLVSTFRERYPDTFAFEGNRAIVFALEDEIAEEPLKHCISLALTYHAEPARSAGRDILRDRRTRARKQGAR